MPSILRGTLVLLALAQSAPALAGARKATAPAAPTCPTGPTELVATYNTGVAALNASRIEEAVAAFQAVTAQAPDCADGWHVLGLARLRENDPSTALAALLEADRLRPGTAGFLASISHARFATQDFTAARAAAEAAIAADPASLDALQALLDVDLREGTYDHARAALDAAQGHIPRDALDCERTRIDTEVGDWAASQKHLPACARIGNLTQHDIVVARVARAQGDYATASKREAALGADGMAGIGIATTALQRGDTTTALAALDALIAERPDVVDARLLRGNLHANAGDYEAALVDYQAARAGGPWVDVERTGVVTGVLTASGERATLQNIQAAAENERLALLALERWDDAAARIAEARAAGQNGPELALQEAEVAAGRDAPELWARLDAAVAAGADPKSVEALAAKRAFEAAASVPEAWASRLATGSPGARRSLLAGESNAGLYEACWRDAQPTLRDPASDNDGAIRAVAARCAVALGRPDDALPVVKALAKAGHADPAATLTTAQLLADAARPEEALALLADLRTDDARMSAAAATLRLTCHSALNHFDEAIRLAGDATTDPVARANVAVGLLNADRPADAVPILQAACPDVPADARAWCAEVLASARSRSKK